MVKSFILKIIVIAASGLFTMSTLTATEAVSSELLFILDCSGSMWGRVDDQPKIVIAKKVLKDLLDDVPETIHMGLLAYGHREKGNCNDIELVSHIGASKQDLIHQLLNLKAQGKTPIEKALQQSSKLLSKPDSGNTVILISDGIETCDGDPCGYIKTLREQGINIKIHVIGFNVTSQAAEQLHCIADAGDGGFFPANNTEELKDALQRLKETIVEEKPLPEPPAVKEVEQQKTTSKRLKLPGPGTVILKPAPWVTMPPRYWSLVDAETGEQVTRANADSTRVKPGEYQLAWRQNEHESTEVMLTATVAVKSGEKVELPVDTGIRITNPKIISSPRWWGLDDPDTGKVIARFSGPMTAQVIPAGRYTLLWRQKEHGAITVSLGNHEFIAGELNDIVLDMGINIKPAEWLPNSFYYISLKDPEGKTIGSWNDLSPQVAPPGDYTVVIRPTEHNNNDIIWSTVTIPDHGFADVSIDSGIKFIHDPDAKPPYHIFFTNLETKEEIAIKETWSPQPLPPGRYQLDWWENQHQSKRQTLIEEFKMEPGTVLELEI